GIRTGRRHHRHRAGRGDPRTPGRPERTFLGGEPRNHARLESLLSAVAAEQTMISSNDLRNGITIVIEGQLWTVIEFQHVKPGKGSAFVRTRLKNVKSGATVERTFR